MQRAYEWGMAALERRGLPTQRRPERKRDKSTKPETDPTLRHRRNAKHCLFPKVPSNSPLGRKTQDTGTLLGGSNGQSFYQLWSGLSPCVEQQQLLAWHLGPCHMKSMSLYPPFAHAGKLGIQHSRRDGQTPATHVILTEGTAAETPTLSNLLLPGCFWGWHIRGLSRKHQAM